MFEMANLKENNLAGFKKCRNFLQNIEILRIKHANMLEKI